jgi:recombination protein RecR
MSAKYPRTILTLIGYLKKFPGVGQRTAERFVFGLLKWKSSHLEEFAKYLLDIKKNIRTCPECGCISEIDGCHFCDGSRDKDSICIVSSAKDIFSIEKTGSYKGLYHVVDDLLSPLDGRGSDHLKMDNLKQRILKNKIKEIIIAFDASLEGDATALFLKEDLKSLKVNVSRLAFGMPVGSSMEYVDGGTLTKALLGRQTF